MFALGCRSRTARPCVVCRLSTVVWRAVRTVATLWHSRTGHTGQAEAPGGGAQGQGAKPLACTMYFVCFSCVVHMKRFSVIISVILCYVTPGDELSTTHKPRAAGGTAKKTRRIIATSR